MTSQSLLAIYGPKLKGPPRCVPRIGFGTWWMPTLEGCSAIRSRIWGCARARQAFVTVRRGAESHTLIACCAMARLCSRWGAPLICLCEERTSRATSMNTRALPKLIRIRDTAISGDPLGSNSSLLGADHSESSMLGVEQRREYHEDVPNDTARSIVGCRPGTSNPFGQALGGLWIFACRNSTAVSRVVRDDGSGNLGPE